MLKRFRPSLRALFIHVFAMSIVIGCHLWLSSLNQSFSPLYLALAEGVIATIIGMMSGLRTWWIPINLLFFPLLVVALSYAINPLWYLLFFLVIWLLNWNAFGEQVPLYLSGYKTIESLATQIDNKNSFIFADFGCGIASVLVTLAQRYPNARFVGYETSPLPYLIAKIRSLGKSNLNIKRQSFWQTQWNDYDVIYCFLSPAPMPNIEAEAKNKIKPGATLISNTFFLPNNKANKVIDVNDLRETKLYIYYYK